MRSIRQTTAASRSRLLLVAIAVSGFLALPAHAPAVEHVSIAPRDSLTNAEFWSFFTSMSEPDGYFLSENLVSNEVSFQEVIPVLQKTLTKGGVYLGVGPEQNFTYIANLHPRMAVIFDIRRQNAMQHLMYKALFELSETREEFVARLFSRPSVARLTPGIAVRALFDSAEAAPASDSAYRANLAAIVDLLVKKRGFPVPAEDIASVRHVYEVFFKAGPRVNYGYRAGGPVYRSTYPDYGLLQAATNADSVQMAFLATDRNYQALRHLQLRNLIVPVVGDFGGPTAIRSVGNWIRDRRMTVTAFYVSNVEQYLFRELGASDRFYVNVSSLPLDSTSRFIRSVPGMGGGMVFRATTSQGNTPAGGLRFVVTRDALGNTTTQTFRDSAGIALVQTTRDTARRDTALVRLQAVRDSVFQKALRDMAGTDTALMRMLRGITARRDSVTSGVGQWQVLTGAPTVVRGAGLLASGVASIQGTLRSFFLGELKDYNAIIGMTKVNGWK